MLEYQNIFTKGYAANWSEEVFKIKNTIPQTYAIINLNGNPLLELLMRKNCEKQIKTNTKQKK